MKRLLLLLLLATSVSAQSLTFSPNNVSFTSRETMPGDFGVPITITGSGTWTERNDTPLTCGGTIANWSDGVGHDAITSIVATATPTTYYVRPNIFQTSTCAKGDYVITMPFANGSNTVNFTINLHVVYRFGASVYFNGFNGADASLSSRGWSMGTPPSLMYYYALNKGPCSTCNPLGTASLTAKPAAGSTWTDELGNTVTVITPPNYNHTNSEKSVLNSDKTLAIVSKSNGPFAVFQAAGQSTPDWSNLNDGTDFGSSGGYGWSSTAPKVLYSMIDSGFKGGNNGTLKEITLTTAPNYNVATLGTISGKGRYLSFGPARGDVNALNWMTFPTAADYQTVVNIIGTAVHRVSGDSFDAKLLDQRLRNVFNQEIGSDLEVAAVIDSDNLVLKNAPGDATGETITFVVPWYLCSVNFPDIKANGFTSTNFVCGDLTAMARPHISYFQGGSWSSPDKDSLTGKMYQYYGNIPYDVVGSFTPGVDSTSTLVRTAITPNDYFSAICGDGAANNSPVQSGRADRCLAGSHGDTFQMSDGTQWVVIGQDGATLYRLSDLAAGRPSKIFEAGSGGIFTQLQYLNFIGTEFSGARKAPYWETTSSISSGFVKSYQITNCTNANPAVVTLDSAPTFGTGANNILINNVGGNTACNGIHSAISIAGNNVTLEVNGNGAYTASTGALIANTAQTWDNPEADQINIFRDFGQESHRVGHTHSIQFSNDRLFTGFWGQPRASLSMDGTCTIYTTSWGLPDNLQVMKVCPPTIGGTMSMQPNMFDLTHSVTSVVVGANSVTLSYSTPDTGNAVVDVCQNVHLPDVPGGSSPDASCRTLTDSSGMNPRSTGFNGLTAGQQYHYRIVANNKWLAYGVFVPGVQNGPALALQGASTLRGKAGP